MNTVSKYIFFIFFLLSLFGVAMVYSASFDLSLVLKQLLAVVVGIVMFFVVYRMDIDNIKQYLVPIVVINILLLVLVLTPLGIEVNGSRAWLGIGPVNIQPSEFAKLAIVLYTAYFISNRMNVVEDFKRGFVPPFLLMLIFAILINLEPDLGNASIVALLFLMIMFIGGTPLWHFLPLAVFSFIGFWVLLFTKSYRVKRILAFIDPWKDPLGYGYNIIQSLIAHGRGHIWGVGFGNSVQKNYYLPEKHTDFIYAVVGEELGLVGNIIILIIFVLFFTFVVHKALRINNVFYRLVLFGLGFMIFVNAVINISVTLSLLPATGVTLPFVSYGGTSLIVNWIALGIIVSIINKPDEVKKVDVHNKIVFQKSV
ncbi:MAG: putative lipid II flippase FtsW [bacterium]|nr:putative lipid II flippase FtsW [bacterium]